MWKASVTFIFTTSGTHNPELEMSKLRFVPLYDQSHIILISSCVCGLCLNFSLVYIHMLLEHFLKLVKFFYILGFSQANIF